MDLGAFSDPSGRLLKISDGNTVFVPNSLPPDIDYDRATTKLIADSHTKLGRLSGIGELLPNPHILISPYLRREAVLSSRIEGTKASLADLFQYELNGKESIDEAWKRVREVRNYVQALENSLGVIKKTDHYIDLEVIKHAHRTLLQAVRGEDRSPGNFRKIQVHIGSSRKIEDARYVPPGPETLSDLLANLEAFIRDPPPDMPILVQCALLHYQFEAIHPFVDGNGRIGRLLITLFLCERNILPLPLLYLSAFFEKNRTEYFDRLLAVSQRSEWANWIKFFLNAVSQQADEAIQNINIRALLRLKDRYEDLLRKHSATRNAHLLKDGLFSNPYTTINNASEFLKVSFVTAQKTIEFLRGYGILTQVTKRPRNRIFVAKEILGILS